MDGNSPLTPNMVHGDLDTLFILRHGAFPRERDRSEDDCEFMEDDSRHGSMHAARQTAG